MISCPTQKCIDGWNGIKKNLAIQNGNAKRLRTVMTTLLLVIVITLLSVQVKSDSIRVKERNEIQAEWSVLKEYCEKQPEKLYLMDVFSSVRYSGLQYEKDCSNLMLAGGWMSATPSAKQRFEAKGVSDGGEALYNDAQTVILADKTRDVANLQKYMSKRFGECSLDVVSEIDCGENRTFVEYRVIH
jgi:hypothetical protein